MKNSLVPFFQIKKILEKELSASRYRHSLAVGILAKKLAKIHGVNPMDAERAGVVHDCAKEWTPKKMLSFVKKKKITIPSLDFILKYSPNMMHAYVGSVWAFEQGWINPQQQKAVASHTLVELPMSLLDKIIYISDFAAYDRGYKQAKKVRSMAKTNLQEAFVSTMRYKILFSLKKSKPIHPYSTEMWNYFNAR